MSDDLDHSDLHRALALLTNRNYGEEGIPMMLVLENESSVVTGVDPSVGCLGPLLRIAAKAVGLHKCEHSVVNLALLIEWIAHCTFGPDSLAQNGKRGA